MKKIVDKDCYTDSVFENIKNIDEYGNEYGYARELQKVLEYKDGRNFLKVINTAKISCLNSKSIVEVNKMVEIGLLKSTSQ